MDNLFKSDPLRWWKRHADTYLDGLAVYPGDIWGNWRLEEFQEYVNLRPLSRIDVDYFLNFRIRDFILADNNRFTLCIEDKSPVLFDMVLDLTGEEGSIGLVHEVVHGFYRYRGIPYGGYDRPEEQAVEDEAKRFCQKNSEFMSKCIDSIRSNIRHHNHQL